MTEKLAIPRQEGYQREVIGALLDALYALRDLVAASDGVPEGPLGQILKAEVERRARLALGRFDFDEGSDGDV